MPRRLILSLSCLLDRMQPLVCTHGRTALAGVCASEFDHYLRKIDCNFNFGVPRTRDC